MDKSVLDWVFLYGPTLYMIVIAVLGTVFNWKRFFRVEKDRLGTPTKVYIGQSRLIKILFEINSIIGVLCILSIFVYLFFFEYWVGE